MQDEGVFVKKFKFLIVGVCVSSTLFGMEHKASSPIVISPIVSKRKTSIEFVGKQESHSSPRVSPRYGSRSRLSSSPDVPQNSPQLDRVRRQSDPTQCNTAALFLALSTIRENNSPQ